MGRKKLTNERYQIRCHPKAIFAVREFAKSESKKHLKSESKSNDKRN